LETGEVRAGVGNPRQQFDLSFRSHGPFQN
jgi:hypothetical protein